MVPPANSVLGLSAVWMGCAHSKVANSVSQGTFRMGWDVLCAQIQCMGARSVQEVKLARSAPIVSCRLIPLRAVVNVT